MSLTFRAADADLALCCIVKPGDQLDDSAFARAGHPHQGHLFPLLYRQRAIPQHIRLPVIGEGHMVQFNAVVLREWPASFKDRKLQDLPHLSTPLRAWAKVVDIFWSGRISVKYMPPT